MKSKVKLRCLLLAALATCTVGITQAKAETEIKNEVLYVSGSAQFTTTSCIPGSSPTSGTYYNQSTGMYYYCHQGWAEYPTSNYGYDMVITGNAGKYMCARGYIGVQRQCTRSVQVADSSLRKCGCGQTYSPYSRTIGATGYTHEMDQKKKYSKVIIRNAMVQIQEGNRHVSTAVSPGPVPIEINGGSYSGTPAITGGTVTVLKGSITDYGSAQSSYILGPDSEQTVTSTPADAAGRGGKTITTIKLSNPPIIIDWAEFPGIDLSVDLNAPMLTCTREPASP